MQFIHEPTRDILIYPGFPPNVQALPDARMLNANSFWVPRTLASSQVLRYYNYPVPPVITDANYSWPRQPGIKPYESQKLAANFMALHRRCFNLSDMGCVAGETLIETDKGPMRIDALAQRGAPIRVKAVVSGTIKIVPATAPFVKGVEKLYRVRFASGRSIDVTAKHFFWTYRGWVSCANLVVGEPLPKFDADLPASTLEFCPSKSLPNAPHWTQTIPNSPGYFYTPACDAPLLQEEDISPASTPLQVDAPTRTRPLLRRDAWGTRYKNMDHWDAGLLSTRRCSARAAQYHTEFLAYESTTKHADNQARTCEQYPRFSTLPRPTHEDRELRNDYARYPAGRGFFQPQHDDAPLGTLRQTSLQFEQFLNLAPTNHAHPQLKKDVPSQPFPVDTVIHIAYLKTDVYYDLHVPTHENYIAHGLCHHNTGKTLSVLWAADWLMKQYPKGECRALIVAPLSTLQRVWSDAIFKNFLSHRTFEILHGTPTKRIEALSRDADFYIINFDGVGTGAHTRKRLELDGFSRDLAERTDIKIAIVDEASAYKDATTKRHRLARLIFAQREYLWLLSGTPTPNAPTDAYGLAKLVNNSFGKSFTTFQNETMFKVSNFIWKPQKDGYDKARKLLSPSIRFDIKDVWDSPEMTTQQRSVELTDQQKKLLADLKRDLQVVVKSGAQITAVNEAALRTKFMQIVLGALYDSNHKAHEIDAGPRIAELKELIEQAPGKLLVFAPLTSVIHLLYKELKFQWACAIVNGETSQKERSAIFEAFQRAPDSEPRILVCDARTMSHGLDLWQAQTAIWYGPSDSTETYLQANKRAHRPGQRFPVTVVQLVATPLEQEIYRRLETNTSLQGALLDAVRKGEI